MTEIERGRAVRFRRRSGGRWHPGTITGPADGGAALWVRDGYSGASRCLRLDQVEVAEPGPKGGTVWATVAATTPKPGEWVQQTLR